MIPIGVGSGVGARQWERWRGSHLPHLKGLPVSRNGRFTGGWSLPRSLKLDLSIESLGVGALEVGPAGPRVSPKGLPL